MRSDLLKSRLLLLATAVAVSFSGLATVQAGPPTKAQKAKADAIDAGAAKTLRQALEAELAGDLERRSELLAAALKQSPGYAPAQWQSGRVRLGAQWLPVADAELHYRRHQDDPTRVEYERLRDKTDDSQDGHASLAKWCRKHKFDAEARFHFLRVLAFDPQDAVALKNLGLHWHNGAHVSNEELARLKREAGAKLKAYDRWHVQLARWRHDLTSGDDTARSAALAGIAALDDVNVIPVFEELLLTHSAENNRGPVFSTAMVEALATLRDPRVNEALVRQATLSKFPETRAAAAKALKDRDPVEYVPNLLGTLRSPLMRRFSIDVGLHLVVYRQELYRESAEVDDYRYTELSYAGEVAQQELSLGRSVRELPSPEVVNSDKNALRFATEKASLDETAVATENAATAATNAAIRALLAANFDQDFGDNFEAWWTWWSNYNELYSPGDKPLRYGSYECWITTPSCFVAGTLVSAQTGLRPIDEIKPGDRVLSQNPQSGELAYKIVLATTKRPPTALRRLTVGSEEILATRGHRFWREGRGWQMAKELDASAMLRGVDGPVRLDAIDDAPSQEAFNLVIDDFHTYFVGAERLLVHDNSAPKPILGPVPGLVDTPEKPEK
jgi:hypothetical protein